MQPTPPRALVACRRDLMLALLGLSAAGLSGCNSLGLPRSITLDEAELQRRLAALFPIERRLLDVVDLQLSAPRLQLLPDQNRLAVALTLRSEDRLWRRPLQGQLGFDTGLRYAPADASLRLSQVRVHTLALDDGNDSRGADGLATAAPGRQPLAGLASRLARVAAEQLLEDLSLYRLDERRQAQLRQAGLRPDTVQVTPRGVTVTLLPLA